MSDFIKFINSHFVQITAFIVAVGSGVRWFLVWLSKRNRANAIQHLKIIKESPDIVSASIDAMSDVIDYYNIALDDCKGSLKECQEAKKHE